MTTLRPAGLLADFDAAGVLAPADVHVATRLCVLGGESDERVRLAIALVVRGTRHGSVVLDLAEAATTIASESEDDADSGDPAELPWPEPADWVVACARSPIVDTSRPGGAPLRIDRTRLWLDRYWRQEAQVAAELLARSAERPDDLDLAALRADLDELFDDAAADQRMATAVAVLSRVSVIGGGPGTGKTTTIARVIAVLRRRRPDLRIALAAPTGKAAARLEEAIHGAGAPLRAADRAVLAALSASTLHRLLGRRPGTASRFRHDRDNRLPYDVVIVDESSMVSLTMMARLLEALAPTARLVLVGDPDQLASVEAGAVLGDLVDQDDVGPVTNAFGAKLREVTGGVSPVTRLDGPGAALRESVAMLRAVHRFDERGPIAELARHVRAGRGDDALAMLRAGLDGLTLHETPDAEPLDAAATAAVQRQAAAEHDVIAAARAGAAEDALRALDQHRLLCAHRGGPRGVRTWSDAVERWLAAGDPLLAPRLDGRYAGQPLLVTSNDYDNGLYNGDTGVVVQDGDELLAAFRRGSQPVLLPLVRLAEVRPLHAMTIHRAQGSQFEQVTVLLPFAASALATRQTFYTAITRAASRVDLVGSADAVLACVERPAARATGLRDRLAGTLG